MLLRLNGGVRAAFCRNNASILACAELPSESAMILLIEACADVESIFALLLEEVTRQNQAYSERRIAYRKKKYQRRYR